MLAPGVKLRHPGEPRPAKYRRRPEPQGAFHEEAADAELRVAHERKVIAMRVRAR